MKKLSECKLGETPVCIMALETTGLLPEGDRVVEVSLVRLRPDGSVEAEFETLVHPDRRMAGTELHGITDKEVKGAPQFREVIPVIRRFMEGAVLAAYNIHYDIKFLAAEFAREGLDIDPPHLCLMFMRPLLGLGERCTLTEACAAHGVTHRNTHLAHDDALASAGLWKVYLAEARRQGIETYEQLRGSRNFRFLRSFDRELPAPSPEEPPVAGGLRTVSRRFSRAEEATGSSSPARPASLRFRDVEPIHKSGGLPDYWAALQVAFADLRLTREEQASLLAKQTKLGLNPGQIRWAHSRLFEAVVAGYGSDGIIDDEENLAISHLHRDLKALGYAPGAAAAAGERWPAKAKWTVAALGLLWLATAALAILSR